MGIKVKSSYILGSIPKGRCSKQVFLIDRKLILYL